MGRDIAGFFPTLAGDVPISHPRVDMICVGEGEHAIIELANRLNNGEDYSNVQNLWVKGEDRITKNPMRPPIDLNDVPFGDFDSFDKERFYRPVSVHVDSAGRGFVADCYRHRVQIYQKL